MKNPRVFLVVIFFVSIILLFLSLPSKISIGNFSFDPKNAKLNLGFTTITKDLTYRLGLDLKGGTQLTYSLDMSEIRSSERDDAFESARNIIEKRINFLGVSEPSVQTVRVAEDYRIVVELPGLSNVGQAIDLIGQTAQLTFWENDPDNESQASSSADLLLAALQLTVGENPRQTLLTGKDLKKASVVFGQSGRPDVQLDFTNEGSSLFAEITKRNVGKIVAIVLDDEIISAPVVQQAIINGNAVITGNFTTDTAKNLSIALNAGALPAPLKVIGQRSVGPTLGLESLQKSLFAAVIGLLSVAIFMIYIYKKEGALACIALGIYAVIVIFIFKIIPVTLTLAGIAGFILSIGIAVDANILIFERMKEELLDGKPREVAIRVGFSRAWPSIRDSNIASIITTIILFYFGSGIIRGFALTLFIGIMVSMFSAIMITKNLLLVFNKKDI